MNILLTAMFPTSNGPLLCSVYECRTPGPIFLKVPPGAVSGLIFIPRV